jgi:hypothetical protein
MNFPTVAAIVILVLAFLGSYASSYDFSKSQVYEGSQPFVTPYYFVVNELTSAINAYFFVFIFSLLFFGYSAPIAMGIEGAKYGSLLAHGIMNVFDLIFIFPQLLGAYSAILLGQGVIDDIEGKTIFENWGRALKFFLIGLAITVFLFLVRFMVSGSIIK